MKHTKEIERQNAELREYTSHKAWCFMYLLPSNPERRCTCGLDKALADDKAVHTGTIAHHRLACPALEGGICNCETANNLTALRGIGGECV